MANILYGINGEGSGHWTRSKEVIAHLRESGHKVFIATSGRALANLGSETEVLEIFGFRFEFNKGRVDEIRTFFKNTDVIPKAAPSVRKLTKLIENENIGLVITDFEPITCLAGRSKRIPIVSIDNQHFITRTDVDFPPKYAVQANITRAAIEMMIPRAKRYLAMSFFSGNPQGNKVIVIPPILRRRIFDLVPVRGEYILVYVTHGSGGVAEILKKIRYEFIFYGTNREGRDGNIMFRKFDQEKFLTDLAGSGGVFATAGFSLISEALYLRKPYLAWPVPNQFEQIFNAYHIERLGYGKSICFPTQEGIESFLFNLKYYEESLDGYLFEGNASAFEQLDKAIEDLT